MDAVAGSADPLAVLDLHGAIQYANEACWERILEVWDVEERLPGVNYFAVAFSGRHLAEAKAKLEGILDAARPWVEGEAVIGGQRWKIRLQRRESDIVALHFPAA